jgi:hypothetical protein
MSLPNCFASGRGVGESIGSVIRQRYDGSSLGKGRVGKESLIRIVVVVFQGLDHLIQSTSRRSGRSFISLPIFFRKRVRLVPRTTSAIRDFQGGTKLTIASDATGAMRVLTFQQGCLCVGCSHGGGRMNGSSNCWSSQNYCLQLAPANRREVGYIRTRNVRMRGLTPRRRLGTIAGASIGIAGVAGTKPRRLVGTRQGRWRDFGFMLGDLKFASACIC